MVGTVNATELRNYRTLRQSGLPASYALHVAKSAEEARRLGLDFEQSPFTVEWKNRALRVETVYDESPDTSWLEDCYESPDDYPESFYGLVVEDVATGEGSSLWGIEYDTRDGIRTLQTMAYLFDTFEQVAGDAFYAAANRSSHG